MAHARPFEDESALSRIAERVWWSLSEQDWLEAFAAHPRIGQRKEGADAHSAWSRQEQDAALTAAERTQARLQLLNDEYAAKFGFIYIVCAAGRSGDELLALLEERLQRPRAEELRTAAEEQARITRLRIRRLLEQP
jgi:OHCU decarboxylase